MGCKTTYRAYASDKVVELKKQARDVCLTNIGKLCGLEPVTTHCRWYPSASCPERKVEGIYLLKQLPNLRNADGMLLEVIKPQVFPNDAKSVIEDCIKCVNDKFVGDDSKCQALEDWNMWKNTVAPIFLTVEEYLTHLSVNNILGQYHQPLAAYVCIAGKYNKGIMETAINAAVDSNFEWPEILAAAMPSVQTNFQRHPPLPRLYVSTAANITNCTQFYKNCTLTFYNNMTTLSLEKLKKMLVQKVSYNGYCLATTGTKAELINRAKTYDVQIIAYLYHPVAPALLQYQNEIIVSESLLNESIAKVNDMDVTRVNLKQFRANSNLTSNTMNLLLELFTIRQTKLLNMFNEDMKNKYRTFVFESSNTLTNIVHSVENVNILHGVQ
jgi:hypothetical protein